MAMSITTSCIKKASVNYTPNKKVGAEVRTHFRFQVR